MLGPMPALFALQRRIVHLSKLALVLAIVQSVSSGHLRVSENPFSQSAVLSTGASSVSPHFDFLRGDDG